LLSAAAVTTSFLGAQALQDSGSNPFLWLALLCFLSARHVIEGYIEPVETTSVAELHRDLSIYMYNSYLENRAGLEQLAAFLQVASGLVTLEVALWMVSIAGRL
jgi:hypothetical protein